MARLFALCCRRSTARGSKCARQWDGVEGDGTPVQLVPAWGRWEDVLHREEARGVNCELPWLQMCNSARIWSLWRLMHRATLSAALEKKGPLA